MNAEPQIETGWIVDADPQSLRPSEISTNRLVSHNIPAPGLTFTNFLQQAEGHPRFFWNKGGDEIVYAGFGTAVQMMAWGAGRFKEIQQKAAAFFDQAQLLGSGEAALLPRLFGGFSFNDDFTPDNTWTQFHPAHFILPHYQLVQNNKGVWLIINALTAESDDQEALKDQLHEALEARYQLLLKTETEQGSQNTTNIFDVRYPMSNETWERIVNQAIQLMDHSDLQKVVLARICELKATSRINIHQAISYLNDHFQGCTRFLFEPRPFHAFYGATPELLVKVSERQVSAMALAGSKPRGATAEQDISNSNDLIASVKERHEHQLVVDAVRRRLEPITVNLDIPEVPEILSLSYIHHLLTPISGLLRHNEGVLPLVELLHPTPALGGSPREMALDFIKDREPVPRGWYAGPVGWLDSSLDGEFVVAIRSAVTQERRVWCYAGAGIVSDSVAQKEWAETELKFKPMLRALGVSSNSSPVDSLKEQHHHG